MIQEVNYTQIKENEDEFSKFIALCVVVKFEGGFEKEKTKEGN